MAHLCVFATTGLEYTWVGASDDPSGIFKEVAKDDPPNLISGWAFFPQQGHLLADILNAFEKEHVSKGWHAAPPEVVTLAIAGIVHKSLSGYRALQGHFDPSVGGYAWP